MNKYTHINKIKGSRSLYGTFLYVTLLPLILFGITLMIYSSYTQTKNIQTEVNSNLKNVGISVLAAYDVMYEGDYNVIVVNDDVEFYKGNTLLSGDYTIIDAIKEQTDVDISIFFYDTRVLTTICDENGDRFIDTGVNATILNTVVLDKTSNFYSGVKINSGKYFAYYQPIMSKDGQTCLGMIGTATNSVSVAEMIRKSVAQNILIMLFALVITALAIMRFTSEIIVVIKKIMKFLSELSEGNLSAEIDAKVVDRSDELGEMGRLTLKLRGSLRKLIEKDALTGIYNRRYGQNKLKEIMERGGSFSVAIGDIDFFKKFNDSYGHECGDVVLRAVAKTLSENMRTCGFAARWGGEEFLLVFENMEAVAAGTVTEHILDEVRSHIVEYDGVVHNVTMSFGVVSGQHELSLDENLNNADIKLYEAKENGRNRVIIEE